MSDWGEWNESIYPITKKSEKVKWQKLREQLAIVRTQKAIDVFELVYQTGLIPIPPKLDRKLFWNSRHSAISWNSRTLSAYRENNSFCASVMVDWSFSSFRLIRWRASLYSAQGHVSYSVGSILPYQSSSRILILRSPLRLAPGVLALELLDFRPINAYNSSNISCFSRKCADYLFRFVSHEPWHSRGQRFDPAYLHQKSTDSTLNRCFF